MAVVGLTPPRKRPRYNKIGGQLFPLCFNPNFVQEAINYKPTASDIFVATYPKCGTTRMIQIVLLILNKGKLPTNADDYFASCPFLEMFGPGVIQDMPGPGCLKTHLPFQLTPFSPHAKYIYVARNPKDCLVSFYYHTKFFPAYYFTNGTFDEFFEVFIKGEVDFGDFFDHLLSWYKELHRPNIFFTTFEDINADPVGTVLKVAEFLGEQYSSLLGKDERLQEEIVNKSSFSYMQKSTNVMFDEIVSRPWDIMADPKMPDGLRFWADVTASALDEGEISEGQFVRSGLGNNSGKVRLSQEQELRLENRIVDKTRNSDVMNIWR